jgi:hypothetical protein
MRRPVAVQEAAVSEPHWLVTHDASPPAVLPVSLSCVPHVHLGERVESEPAMLEFEQGEVQLRLEYHSPHEELDAEPVDCGSESRLRGSRLIGPEEINRPPVMVRHGHSIDCGRDVCVARLVIGFP